MGLPGQLTIIHKGSGMQVVRFHGHANICLEGQSYKDRLLTQGSGQYEGKMGGFLGTQNCFAVFTAFLSRKELKN